MPSLVRLREPLVGGAAEVGGVLSGPALGATAVRGYQPSSLVHFTTLMFTCE